MYIGALSILCLIVAIAVITFACLVVDYFRKRNKDITKTSGYKEAMNDIKNGRVYHVDNVDDMFNQILG